MPDDDKLALDLGQQGVDIVSSPLHTPSGGLLEAQNAEYIRDQGVGGIGSRGALFPLNWEVLDGPVMAAAAVPLPSPADLVVPTLSITPDTEATDGAGETTTATVTAANTAWLALSTVPWVLITGGGFGTPLTSPTTLSYTVLPFTGGTGSRVGKILVIGVGAGVTDTLTITQSAIFEGFWLGGVGGLYLSTGGAAALRALPDVPVSPDYSLYPWMFGLYTRGQVDLTADISYWAGEYDSGGGTTPIFKWDGQNNPEHFADVVGHVTQLLLQNQILYACAVDRGYAVQDSGGSPVAVSGRVVIIDTDTGDNTQFLDLFGHAHGDSFTMNARYVANSAFPVGWAPGALCGLGDDCIGIMLSSFPDTDTGLSPDPAVFPGWKWGPFNAGAAATNFWVGQMLPLAGNINDTTWSASGGIPDMLNKPWVNPDVAGSFSASPRFSILGDVPTNLVRGKIPFTPRRSPVDGIQYDGVAFCATLVTAGANPDGFGPYGADPVSGAGFGYFVPGDHAMIMSSQHNRVVGDLGGNEDNWYGLVADSGGTAVSMLNTGVLPDGARLRNPALGAGAQALGWLATNVSVSTDTPLNFIAPDSNPGVAWFGGFIVGPDGQLYVAYCSATDIAGDVVDAKIYRLNGASSGFVEDADVATDFGLAYPGQPFIFDNVLYWPWVGKPGSSGAGFLLQNGVSGWALFQGGLDLTGIAGTGPLAV